MTFCHYLIYIPIYYLNFHGSVLERFFKGIVLVDDFFYKKITYFY